MSADQSAGSQPDRQPQLCPSCESYHPSVRFCEVCKAKPPYCRDIPEGHMFCADEYHNTPAEPVVAAPAEPPAPTARCPACHRTDHTDHLDWLNHPERHEKGCKCLGHASGAAASPEPLKERSAQDYAIEHAGYLADAVDHYLEERNKFDALDTVDVGDQDSLNDHIRECIALYYGDLRWWDILGLLVLGIVVTTALVFGHF